RFELVDIFTRLCTSHSKSLRDLTLVALTSYLSLIQLLSHGALRHRRSHPRHPLHQLGCPQSDLSFTQVSTTHTTAESISQSFHSFVRSSSCVAATRTLSSDSKRMLRITQQVPYSTRSSTADHAH